MRRAVLALISTVLANAASGDPAPLAAVGRVDLGDGASCSGTLIAPDLVLTAGHCLLGEVRGRPLSAEGLRFRPGRSLGVPPPGGHAGRALAVHPMYGFGIGPRGMRMGFDLGLLRLATPVPERAARPLALGGLPAVGDRVVIAGYRGGEGTTARQRSCDVIEANHAFTALGCAVDAGESGSPMLRPTPDGPVIVGVLANKGRIEGQPVAFGPVTETGFGALRAHLGNIEALRADRAAMGLEAAGPPSHIPAADAD